MATNQTEHYKLNQWELTDSVVMAEFNADNQKVDAALTALDQKIADAAEQVRAAIPRIQIGTYVGTGTYGADNPTTLTFDFEPQLLIVAPYSGVVRPLIAIRGAAATTVSFDNDRYGGNYEVTVDYLQWENNTVSWYNSSKAASQHNTTDTTYRYWAIG